MKIALYARVSTEDQAKHGLSIDTQLDNLRSWAAANGHAVVGEYVDAGVSGKKSLAKRPALSAFVASLDSQKVDALVFTKLDRFFRSVRLYYAAMTELDKHGVAWQAIQEDYETVTSAGRFRVNIMLSIAEAEADRTSERIKAVFDQKIERGEFLGSILPLGLEADGKKVVPNADAGLARECFRIFRETNSIYRTRTFLEESGHPISYQAVRRLLHNPLYCGMFRGNPDYCPAIVPPEEWEEVQQMLGERSTRENPTKRVYLFSGLIRCEECGRRMAGAWATHGHDNFMYRCNGYYLDKICVNKHHLRESVVESWLIDNIVAELEKAEAAIQPPQKKKKTVDVAAVKKKLARLKDLYVDGLIEKEEYVADRTKLLAQLPKEPPVKDLSPVRRIVLSDDFRERYNELPREEKRRLWRSVVDHITFSNDGILRLYFSP